MRFWSFSRKHNINTLVKVTVTVANQVKKIQQDVTSLCGNCYNK